MTSPSRRDGPPANHRDDAGFGPNQVSILGVKVDAVTLDQAAGQVLAAVRRNRAGGSGREGAGAEADGGAGAGSGLWLLVTPNPEIVMAARADAGLRDILNSADLAVPDGIGLVWASGRLGHPLPGRVAGFDLLCEVMARGAAEGLRVFFLGAKPGVAEAAAAKCRETHPGLVVAGTHHGYFGPEKDGEVARLVASTAPDLVICGMGSPRQEKWLAVYRALPPKPRQVGMPVGGSLDVLAGTVTRAPNWAARLNLEWAVRVLSQPSRWRRAPTLARFVLAVLAGPKGRGAGRNKREV